jgi:hypothetical protein
MPCFDGPFDVIHVSQTLSTSPEHEILLTGVFLTNESDDGNECKPTKMLIRFSGVLFWEYEYGCAKLNGIEMAGVLISPPTGYLAVDSDEFHIVCRKITILSCQHEQFSDLDDETVAT